MKKHLKNIFLNIHNIQNLKNGKEKRFLDVLLTGDHKKIKDWRLAQSEDITRRRRPDLWEKYKKNK